MKLYEVYNPDLGTDVRYKVLSTEETEILVLENSEDREKFARAVLEEVIPNLKTEITLSLRRLPKDKAQNVLQALFTQCLMLNPGLDVDSWLQISHTPQLLSAAAKTVHPSTMTARQNKNHKITKAKFLNLERHLKEMVVGQNEAVEEVVNALKRSQVGLNDETRPLGVFLFAGASGVGKTHLARELHRYLFDSDTEIVRIDCGEYQHKHENQKLIGAPPGYLGHDEGGYLVNAIEQNPHTVVLLDEVEKAHPDIWNTFLRVFDEGTLTSGDGKSVSFREAIIIMTTNLGNGQIVEDMTTRGIGFSRSSIDMASLPRRSQVERVADEAIKKQFRPEFLNRIDKVVVFNHLSKEDYSKIAEQELNRVQQKLERRGFTLAFDGLVLEAMVRDGVSHVQGARGLSQLRRDRIENSLADLILSGRFPRGTAFKVSHEAGDYRVTAQRPASKKRTPDQSAPLVAAPIG